MLISSQDYYIRVFTGKTPYGANGKIISANRRRGKMMVTGSSEKGQSFVEMVDKERPVIYNSFVNYLQNNSKKEMVFV